MIDILVPVLGRPWNAQPLVDSIHRNTDGPYRIVFICSPNDEEQYDACRKTGQETWLIGWRSDRGDFAKKINWAFGQTRGAVGLPGSRRHPLLPRLGPGGARDRAQKERSA